MGYLKQHDVYMLDLNCQYSTSRDFVTAYPLVHSWRSRAAGLPVI